MTRDSENDENPSKPEIRKQLARILASGFFRNSTSQYKVLEFVVNSALDGKEITQRHIDTELFPKGHTDPATSVGRATASNLRERLASYYDGEKEAAVIIELPPGKGYKPGFTYNPASRAHKSYRQAMVHMSRFTSAEDARLTLTYLNEAITLEPEYALAYAARADAQFREAIYRADEPPRKSLELAEASAREALARDARAWRAHVVLGAIHCSRFQWQQAGAAFDEALETAPLEAAEHFYYAAYLAAVGRMDEALRVTRLSVKRHPEDPFAMLALATLCYLTREAMFHAAIEFAYGVERENRNLWIPSALLACISFNTGRAYGMLATLGKGHVEDAHRLLGMECFPGLAVLCFALEMSLSENRPRIDEMKAQMHRMIAALEIKSRESYVSPLQLALAHLAANETDYAFPELKRACKEGDPKMAWLHLWPLFDSIRDHPQFLKLTAKMNLP
jgi:tetratricopeptide (TPR) repeat protein